VSAGTTASRILSWGAILGWGLAAAAAPVPAPAAGGGGLRFREVSAAWGLSFRHHNGASGRLFLMETFGSGVVLFDYDGDGDPDVFFVDSGALPGYRGEPGRSRLYRNDGGGRFREVTAAAGLTVAGYGMGATAGDVDGDGDLDLYVTAYGPNQLFRNEGDGTFTDVTAAAGAGEASWSSSAAFADADGDGDLDLYVADYVLFSLDSYPLCGEPESGLRSYCHPEVFPGLPDRFYRNRGDGTFEDATAAAGFAAADGKGLGVIWGDLDGDGRPDLYVADDTTPNFLFHNRGDGTFEDLSLVSGTAFNAEGKAEAGMGVDLADLDGDGLPELVVTNFDLETNALYGNLGAGLFNDRRFLAQIAEPSRFRVGFGVAFADFDFDGDLDLAIANGHIIPTIERFPEKRGNSYRQPNQVLENLGGGRFRLVAGSGLDAVRSSRGLAAGDLDGDGDVDLVVTNSDDAAEVYENVASSLGGALAVALRAGGGNTAAVGARVEVEAGAVRQAREVRTASSYLSQNEMVLRFGLGPAAKVDSLLIRWPDGRRQRLLGLPAGAAVVVVEPPGKPW
jgi:enediyne biosynthesis protein E4